MLFEIGAPQLIVYPTPIIDTKCKGWVMGYPRITSGSIWKQTIIVYYAVGDSKWDKRFVALHRTYCLAGFPHRVASPPVVNPS